MEDVQAVTEILSDFKKIIYSRDYKLKNLAKCATELLAVTEDLQKQIDNIKQNDSVIIILDSCKELGDGIVEYLKEKLCKINTKFFRFGNNEINIIKLIINIINLIIINPLLFF